MSRVIIIAEAGVNHNGDEYLARELIDVAAVAGADFVKFQTFNTHTLVTDRAEKAEYQSKNDQSTTSQAEMLAKLELDQDCFFRLFEYCKKKNITFMSTAFDISSADFLVRKLKQNILKIPSGEIVNGPYLLEHARYNKKILLSTGMATLTDIEHALSILAFGFLNDPDKKPGRDEFISAYLSKAGQEALRENVSLLHCTTEYPAPYEGANLKCIQTLASTFGLDTGFSDHTDGIAAPIAAVALGASIIEKHFTLDKNLIGPDHRASLDSRELEEMVSGIRNISAALGNGIKAPTPSEQKNKIAVRQSLVAVENIKIGEYLTDKNIGTRRPGSGLAPSLYWDLLGMKATRNYKKYHEIKF